MTLGNDAEPQVDYDVQAYLVHRHEKSAPVFRGMRSGHYIAYFRHGAAWYLADDEKVTMLTQPLTEFPYVVMLARSDGAQGTQMSAMRKRSQWIKKARREAPELPRSSRAATATSDVIAMATPDRPQRAQSSRAPGIAGRAQEQDCSGRVQDRSGRVQDLSRIPI